jgi:hypothetical protein
VDLVLIAGALCVMLALTAWAKSKSDDQDQDPLMPAL